MKMWEKALAAYGLHTEPEPAKHPLYDAEPVVREIYLNATPYVVDQCVDIRHLMNEDDCIKGHYIQRYKDRIIRELCDGIRDHIDISVDYREYEPIVNIRAQINLATKEPY